LLSQYLIEQDKAFFGLFEHNEVVVALVANAPNFMKFFCKRSADQLVLLRMIYLFLNPHATRVLRGHYQRVQNSFDDVSAGLALNLWTADLMGIIPGGDSDVQTKKKNIYERAEG
jgi:hypothetical protein